MSLKGQQSVVAHHAAPIVGNADQLAAARLHFHPDAGGAGVQRILEQLFDHRRGAIDHLARRNLVGDLVGEDVDAPHRAITPAGLDSPGAQIPSLRRRSLLPKATGAGMLGFFLSPGLRSL